MSLNRKSIPPKQNNKKKKKKKEIIFTISFKENRDESINRFAGPLSSSGWKRRSSDETIKNQKESKNRREKYEKEKLNRS
jgi:hypothetical protein